MALSQFRIAHSGSYVYLIYSTVYELRPNLNFDIILLRRFFLCGNHDKKTSTFPIVNS